MMIEHIALYVNDLEAARTFFMKYLGAASNDGYHNPKTDFRSYFLTFDDGARLELMHKPEMPDQPKELSRTGYAHIAFRVGSREKVDALTAELKADGYKVISDPRTTGDGYYEAALLRSRGTRSNSRFDHIVPASAAGRTVGGKSPRRFYFYRERECICSRYPPARNILPIPLSAA